MADSSKRDLDKSNAPDTARVYERAKPEAEGGMGRLDNEEGTPVECADQLDKTVHHRQGNRQINAEDPPKDNGRIKKPVTRK